LVTDAQFSLAWIRLWQPKLDLEDMSKGFPPCTMKEDRPKKHLEAAKNPAKRLINKLLEVDSVYFDVLHYLEPIL
jgi:hypothetical protein